MDTHFWIDKWQSAKHGFHEPAPNALLIDHISALSLPAGSRIFLPLCGKTKDIVWLLSKGYAVVGVELVGMAIDQLFEELGIKPIITTVDELTRYQAPLIDIYVGDVFKANAHVLGHVDAVYDRAALVALPKEMRVQYTAHLVQATLAAPQLLISYEYDQSLMSGPPFSVVEDEIRQHYTQHYTIDILATRSIEKAFNGKCDAVENVWHIKPESGIKKNA